MTLPGVRAVAEGVDPGVAKFDLAFSFREQRPGEEEQGGLAGVIEYMADLFDEDSVEMLAGPGSAAGRGGSRSGCPGGTARDLPAGRAESDLAAVERYRR